MIHHSEINEAKLKGLLKTNRIRFGGNIKLKIYGTLNCGTGKRMKRVHRVFFVSDKDALRNGFRPCGNCMKKEYNKWKDEII